jgi:hypothetical protein
VKCARLRLDVALTKARLSYDHQLQLSLAVKLCQQVVTHRLADVRMLVKVALREQLSK